MRKQYRVLNFQLKTSLLPGKVKSYQGPTTVPAICKMIALEAKENGIDISSSEIEIIAGSFFHRIGSSMDRNDFVQISGLGSFGMTLKKRRDLYKEDDSEYDRRMRLKRYRNYREFRKSQIKKKFNAFNAMRREKGLKEWKYSEYKSVHKPKIPRKLSSKSVLKKK